MPKITPETKIAIGLPRGKNGFTWEWIECLLKMFAKYPARYIPLSEQRPHAQARNEIAKRFLESDAEYLLWIDSDTIWQPEDFKLIFDELDNADMVSGIQFACSEHHLPLIRRMNLKLGVMEPIPVLPKDGNPFEIGGCGFGFVIMKREVVESVPEPRFEFRSGFSEDLYFCIRALQRGFKIHAHPLAMVGHIAEKVFDVRDFIAIPESMRRVYVQNAMIGSNQWLNRVFPDWREDLGLIDMVSADNINTKEYWDEKYKSEVENDYNWRTYPEKFDFIAKELLKVLPENANVLELGAGMGFLLEKIRKEHSDFNLIGVDISSYAVDVMKEKGFKAFVGKLPEWLEENKGDSDVDCVIGCELLEHLDNEDRYKVVKEVYNQLKDGGFAIFTVPDNKFPPYQVEEHRIMFNKERFEKFLNEAFNGNVEVHSKSFVTSDLGGEKWGEVPFLFGICQKVEKVSSLVE